MNATTRLQSEMGQSRIYQTPHRRWPHVVESFITEIGKRHPEAALQQFVHEIDGQGKKEDRIRKLVVKHVCVPGPADIRVLEDYVGCRIQPEIARFYKHFAECVLLLRYPMRIFLRQAS